MSKKRISKTMLVAILTVFGYALPPIIATLFFAMDWPVPAIVNIGLLISIIFAIIMGAIVTFSHNAKILDRIICIACIFLCFNLLLMFLANSGSPREKTKRISCISKLRQIRMALKQYAENNAGYYPTENGEAGLEVLRKNNYLTDYAAYICPGTETVPGKDTQPLTEYNVDYVYFGGLCNKSDPNLPLVYDKPNNHRGFIGYVLFADRTIKEIKGDPWTHNIKK